MEAILGMLHQGHADLPAGVHCSNPDCKTRSGERSRGHQSCRSLLCGHCCQNAAKAAAEVGEARPVCKVHSRRVHTGHKPTRGSSEGHSGGGEGEPDTPQEPVDKRTLMEQALRRSVTLVVWYRDGCEPLRLPYEVATFPLFRLQDFPELVTDLGLQPSSYVDAYNDVTGQWEQHKLTTVRSVEQDQRLLYRLRISLLDGLSDCPSLDHEMSLQRPPQRPNKRDSDDLSPPGPVAKYHRILSPRIPTPSGSGPFIITAGGKVSPSWPVPSTPTPVSAPAASTSSSPATPDVASAAQHTPVTPSSNSWGFAVTGHGHIPTINRASQPRGPPPSTSNTQDKVSKRWPTDYSVHEIVNGFKTMQEIISRDPRERQKSAFEKVFACRYVKSTTGRAKLYWKRSSQEVKDHFLSLSKDDPRGRWSNFIHLMDGRLVIEVDNEVGNEEDENGEEEHLNTGQAVMGSLAPPSESAIQTSAPEANSNINLSSSSLAGATSLSNT